MSRDQILHYQVACIINLDLMVITICSALPAVTTVSRLCAMTSKDHSNPPCSLLYSTRTLVSSFLATRKNGQQRESPGSPSLGLSICTEAASRVGAADDVRRQVMAKTIDAEDALIHMS